MERSTKSEAIKTLGAVFTNAERRGDNPYSAMHKFLINGGIEFGKAAAIVVCWTIEYGQVSSDREN